MKHRFLPILLALAMTCTACGSTAVTPETETQPPVTIGSAAPAGPMEPVEIPADAIAITLNNGATACDSKAVTFAANAVTISKGGCYVLSGELMGMVIVDAGKEDVQLILNNAIIESPSSAAIYVKKGTTTLSLAEGSDNELSNSGAFVAIDDNDIDAVVFSKDDLILNGNGQLSVSTQNGHGIVSKDNLTVNGGVLTIDVSNQGMAGKDSVTLTNGSAAITCGKDGIRAKNSDDAALGNIAISGGSWAFTCEGDGISATNTVEISGGSFVILAGGGAENSQTQQQSADSASTKGIKAANALLIGGGDFTLNTADDGLHTNGDLTISGGTFAIATGDDGIHADSRLAITGGDITVSQSYEGLEGEVVDISGGEIKLKASDDGLNAAGGVDQSGFFGRDAFGSSANAAISISGGRLYVDADGDGLDSNGSMAISGGEIFVSGPTNSGNGALDYDHDGIITGGTILAVGASGMAQNFTENSTQCAALVQTGQQNGGTITVTDSEGKTILTGEANKGFDCVVFSSPELEVGKTYTLTVGSFSTEVTFDTMIFGAGTGGFGGHGGRGDRGDFGGQKPDGDRGDFGGQRPEGTPPEGGPGQFGGMEPPGGMTPPEGDFQIPPGETGQYSEA